MKFETFKFLIESCEKEMDRKDEQDKQLEKIFGGDTQIISDTPFIDDVLDSLLIEYPDTNEDVFSDFIFRVTPRTDDDTFSIDGVEYIDNIENLWLYVEGKL